MVRLGDSPWQVLGIEPGPDEKAVRRAYAELVRRWRPDSHPAEFMQVREAYEQALAMVRYGTWDEVDRDDDAFTNEDAIEPAPVEAVEVAAHAHIDAAPAEAVTPHEPAGFQFGPALARVAEVYNAQGDAAAVAELRLQFESARQGSIDAQIDFEWHFTHSLVTSETPPLGLVFEGERHLRWTERYVELERSFGAAGAQRLAIRVDLAKDWVFQRDYAPNPWVRRLFAQDGPRVPWWGLRTLVAGARDVADRWCTRCDQAGVPALRARLDAAVLSRIEPGRIPVLPDVALGAFAAAVWLASSGGPAAYGAATWIGGAVLVLATFVAACMAVRSVPRWVGRTRWFRWRAALRGTGGYAATGALIAAAIAGAFLTGNANPFLSALGWTGIGVFLGAIGYVLLALWWLLAGTVESWVLVAPWQLVLGTARRNDFEKMCADASREWAPRRVPLADVPKLLSEAWAEARRRRREAAAGHTVNRRWLVVVAIVVALNVARHLLR